MPSTAPHAPHPARRGRPRVAAARVWSVGLVVLTVLSLTVPVAASAADPTPAPSGTRPRTPTATLAPAPPRPTVAPGPTVLGATVTFHGRGYGHGVGLSQYGARGRALAGQDAATILGHYYRGTTLGAVDVATPIRVRVLAAYRATSGAPLVLYGRGGEWTIDGVAGTFPRDARVTVVPTTTGGTTAWRRRVTSPAGTVLHDAVTGSFRMRGASPSTRIQVASRTSNADEYRGVVRVRVTATSASADVVNELPLETYLRGVVPVEMPASWPTEALRAQAIAARSYAVHRLRPGTSYYDVNDDTSAQVYHGFEGERAATDAAIAATAGVVVKAGTTVANTLFHSAGGGATEHNENVFVSSSGTQVAGKVSYLRGVPDRAPDGTPYDAASPWATWTTATYTRAQLSAMFASDPRSDVGALTALDLRRRGVSGRLVSVTLIGSRGTATVSGNVFRAIFNAARPAGHPQMRSTLVDTQPVP